MLGTVPNLSIIFMVISCIAGFAIPVVLFFYFRKKKNADILPFFVGCVVFLLFALILESFAHQIILNSSVGQTIQGNIWLYAFYGGFMAGLFEETGRYIAFKTVLKNKMDKNSNALMYGAGHGGFEAVVVLSITMIVNIVLSMMINQGDISSFTNALSSDNLNEFMRTVQELTSAPSYYFLIGIIERVIAVGLHISLSVLVWFSVKNQNQFYFYPLAIFIHFFIDAFVVLLSSFGLSNVLVEVILAICVIGIGIYVKTIWDTYETE